MTKYLVVLFGVLLVVPAFGADIFLKAGINNSWLATEGGSNETKPVYGIGIQFPIEKTKNIQIGFDLLYLSEYFFLQNRSWQADYFSDEECDILSGDLQIAYQYFHLPVYINSNILKQNNWELTFISGFGLKYAIKNDSRVKKYNFNTELCDYDYERIETDALPVHPIEIFVGSRISYNFIGAQIEYHYTLGKTESLYGLKIQDHIHSIQLMLFLHLNKLFS